MATAPDVELYEFLGLQKFATAKEIHKAYKRLALKLHPDKNPGKDTVEQFQKLGIVYEILTDVGKKEEYDQKLRAKEQAEKRDRERDAKTRELKRQFNEREKVYQEKKKREEEEKEEQRRKTKRKRDEEQEKERLSKKFCDGKGDDGLNYDVSVSLRTDRSDKEPVYTAEEIKEIFSKYGRTSLFKTKEGSYIVSFNNRELAILASSERGKPSRPLTVELSFSVEESPPRATTLASERARSAKRLVEDPRGVSLDFLLGRYGMDPDDLRNFGFDKVSGKSQQKLEEFDERTGLPVRYVYGHGTDTIFACAATFSLPPEIRLRGDEEVEHEGYLVRLWPEERNK